MKITTGNLENFVLIDQIHAGYVEVEKSSVLSELLASNDEINLQPIALFKANFATDIVVKCRETGNTFLAA